MEPTRRTFMQTLAAAGVTIAAADAIADTTNIPGVPASAGQSKSAEELRIALIGAGSEGRNLMMSCLKIPNIRFIAVCDIWPYAQSYARNVLKKYKQIVKTYVDYKEMLAAEKDLDAVIIATPDWAHAEQTIACLKAGKHVYCEKEMSNTIEGARSMVLAARESGKVCQIGHQRRSNPRYLHALKMIRNDKILGRITNCMGQWNRSVQEPIGFPRGEELPAEALKQYGYDTMHRFRNWRWFRQYSGGPIADLGSHQIDIFSWFLGAHPKAVMATGGLEYYKEKFKDREWYDNILTLMEFDTAYGPARAFYQVVNTSGYGGYYEVFMGDEGTLEISEDPKRGAIAREPGVKPREWENEAKIVEHLGVEAIQLKVGETLSPTGKPAMERLASDTDKGVHQIHLENFFNAVRKNDPKAVSCPPEVGFETAVAVLKINDAVAAGKRLEYSADEFKV